MAIRGLFLCADLRDAAVLGRCCVLVGFSGDHIEELLEVEGFGHELDGLTLEDAGFVFAGDGDDAGGAVRFREAHAVVDELKAVHDRHAQVGEQDVETLGEEVTQAFFAVACGDDVGAGLFDQPAHRQPGGCVIFDNQDARTFRERHTSLSMSLRGRQHQRLLSNNQGAKVSRADVSGNRQD